jgi:hypothetical protein
MKNIFLARSFYLAMLLMALSLCACDQRAESAPAKRGAKPDQAAQVQQIGIGHWNCIGGRTK